VFRSRGVAGLLLLRHQNIRDAVIPVAQGDLVHVAITRRQRVRDPRILRVGRLLEQGDTPVVGGAARSLVLVGSSDHDILVRSQLAGGKAVSNIAGPDVMLRPVGRPGVPAPGTRVLVPENVAGRAGPDEV